MDNLVDSLLGKGLERAINTHGVVDAVLYAWLRLGAGRKKRKSSEFALQVVALCGWLYLNRKFKGKIFAMAALLGLRCLIPGSCCAPKAVASSSCCAPKVASSCCSSKKVSPAAAVVGDAKAFTAEQLAGAELLLKAGQGHLFDGWAANPTQDLAQKRALLDTIPTLNKQVPGGLVDYVSRAKTLLENSRSGVNPYEGFIPEVPLGMKLQTATPQGQMEFDELEALGLKNLAGACFVMVAGGMGERLGYNGIKIELPINITTDTCYLEMYCLHIQALQARARSVTGNNTIVLPLAIMTSGDTDASTRALLARGANFGMAEGQITIVKQETVPALSNNQAQFVTKKDDRYKLITKPHGHGDVHCLLYQYGLSSKWAKEGRTHIVFFQDTNGLVFRAVPAALGVSVTKGLAVNSLTVPRRPGEAVGAICKLTNAKQGRALTINVEYNQLDPLMTASKVEDKTDEFGFSAFPGNINVLIFEAQSYAAELKKSRGIINEFVNPKYADAAKTQFKKPTRLECMMQDYPKLLGPEVAVGFTQFERWTCFSAVKNNVVDAKGKQDKTGIAESACTGEADVYWGNRRLLFDAGVKIDLEGEERKYCNIKTKVGARVVLLPSFGVTQAEIKSKFVGQNTISKRSTLVLEGPGITVKGLKLDGALLVSAVEGATVELTDLTVSNKGYDFEPLAQGEQAPETLKIRGYKLTKSEAKVLKADTPGHWVVRGGDLVLA